MLYRAIAFLLFSTASTPAFAVTYIGQFQGNMIDGQADYCGYCDVYDYNFDYVNYDLTGLPVSIDFRAEIIDSYVSDWWDERWVDISVSASVQFPDNRDKRVANSFIIQHNPAASNYATSSYEGNGKAGSLSIAGEINSIQNHYAVMNMDFSGASAKFGPISGSGLLRYGFGYGWHTQGFGNFVLNSGSVQVTDVPEPASWAMMLVGFGAIGAMVRRRKVSVSYA